MTLLPPTETPDGPTQRRGYEARDLRRWSVPIAVMLIVAGAAVLHFGTFALYRVFHARPEPTETAKSAVDPSTVTTNRNLPPLEAEDVRLLRDYENGVFQKLGWETKGNSPDVKIPDAVVNAVKERR